MDGKLHVLGISGSLREDSYNTGALEAARVLTPDFMVVDTFDISDIPPFNQDEENTPPEGVKLLKQKIRQSDAVLFVTPEYDYSVSGVLKNAIDWASRPYGDNAWDGKPVAVMGASISMTGTARAQYDLRKMFVFLNMHPLNIPEVMIPYAWDKFDENGNLIDEHTKEKIRELLFALAEWTLTIEEGKKRSQDILEEQTYYFGMKGGKAKKR